MQNLAWYFQIVVIFIHAIVRSKMAFHSLARMRRTEFAAMNPVIFLFVAQAERHLVSPTRAAKLLLELTKTCCTRSG
jgi:hypothetical protein